MHHMIVGNTKRFEASNYIIVKKDIGVKAFFGIRE